MPELPEVETVRRTLKDSLLNKKILDIDIIYPKIIENVDPNEFKSKLINKEIKAILRKGKFLLFDMEDIYLVSHLRMEGKFFIKNHQDPIEKHEHIIFKFKEFDLRYHDTRKFGRMNLISKNKLKDFFTDLGEDANNITSKEYIYNKIKKSSLPIKTLLLDQSIIAGLGNIYVDEVLYKSGISPLRMGKNITSNDIDEIIKYSKEILDKAIDYKGTTIRSYTSSLGVYGSYQKFLKVHTKVGYKCDMNHDIIKIRVGGRGTYYCPKCQK